jgi:hypothetical protein
MMSFRFVLVAGCLVMPEFAPIAAASDVVPKLNINPTCRGASSMATFSSADASQKESAEVARTTCLAKETAARDELRKEWKNFRASERASCTRSTAMGGIPSYVELQTCLEIARDARKIPGDGLNAGMKDDEVPGRKTTGQGSRQ